MSFGGRGLRPVGRARLASLGTMPWGALLSSGPPLSRSPRLVGCRQTRALRSAWQRSGSDPRIRFNTTRNSWGGSAPRASRGGEVSRRLSRAPTTFGPSQGAVRRPACGAPVGARSTTCDLCSSRYDANFALNAVWPRAYPSGCADERGFGAKRSQGNTRKTEQGWFSHHAPYPCFRPISG